VNGQSMIPAQISDDTIELQLTPEQFRVLSEAAEQAELLDSPRTSAGATAGRIFPPYSPQLLPGSSASRARRWHQAPILKTVGAIVVYAGLAWWGAAQLAAQPQVPATLAGSATAASRPAVGVPRPVPMASAPQAAVRVVNPFDATEVFEFPAGTTHAEGREKVAQILLQRAQERRGQWARVKPVVSVRTASLYPP
jgi:hypothetical protein